MSSIKKPIGDPNLLQRRLVSNPKFNDVQSTVDTGSTVNTVQRYREGEVSIKQNPGEHFKRMRPSSLANFIDMKRSRQEQIQELGEEAANMMLPSQGPKKELLVLDIRDAEDYEKCHIEGALSYPYARLNRSQNIWTTELIYFKNRDNHVVVIYDLEEELTTTKKIGNLFFERGVDNIVVMSGGLKQFVQDYSAMIVGESPVPILPPKPQRMTPGRTSAGRTSLATGGLNQQTLNANHGGAKQFGPGAESTQGQSIATSHKPRSLATSLARPKEGGRAFR